MSKNQYYLCSAFFALRLFPVEEIWPGVKWLFVGKVNWLAGRMLLVIFPFAVFGFCRKIIKVKL